MHRGFTLMQLLVVLGVMSLLSALALPRINGAVNAIAVRGAAADVTGAFALARTVALTRSVYVAVHVDSVRKSVAVATGADTLLVRLVGDVPATSVHVRTAWVDPSRLSSVCARNTTRSSASRRQVSPE